MADVESALGQQASHVRGNTGYRTCISAIERITRVMR
jgi:hypothetical protein